MSPDLIAFLKAWYEWATNGAPDNEPYSRLVGLCANCDDTHPAAFPELEALFEDDYPFGAEDYRARQSADTMHECPKRLAWVRERLIEAGELLPTPNQDTPHGK